MSEITGATITLTPLLPYWDQYESPLTAVTADLDSYGQMTAYSQNLGLQYLHDEICLGGDAVALTDQTIGSYQDVAGRCTAVVSLMLEGTTADQQLFVVFGLRRISGAPTAQMFVEGTLEATKAISGTEAQGILIDCFDDVTEVELYVRLAASTPLGGTMALQYVQCYLV